MSKSLLYVRVSSKVQEREGYSLEAQEKLGKEYAKRNGFEIVRIWRVSESAWKHERKAFNQLIEFAKRHNEIKHIIFDITDRMTRNDFDKLKIYTLINEYNKTIHFARSNKRINKESGADDEFMFDIEVAVAKKMSNDISRKTKMGMTEKAEQGVYPSSAPIGYLNNKLTHKIEIDSSAAPVIKTVFSRMATGNFSLQMLADELYSEGFRSKKGNRIYKSTLSHILKNPIYFGSFFWDRRLYQGIHEPLVTKTIYDRVSEVLCGKSHPSKSQKQFYFNNLITCGICECKILGELKKSTYVYYHCTFSKGRHKDIPYIRQEKLAELFEEPVRRITLPLDISNWLKDVLYEGTKNHCQQQEIRLKTITRENERVRTRLSRLYDTKFDDKIEEEIFLAKEQEYKSQLLDFKCQMENLGNTDRDLFDEGCKIFELCNGLSSLYLDSDYEDKAKLLKVIASNFSLEDLKLYPTYKKPFNFIEKGLESSNWLPR